MWIEFVVPGRLHEEKVRARGFMIHFLSHGCANAAGVRWTAA